jgi:ribosome-binding factor A
MSYRLEKFASTLQQALGEILGRESLDPGLRLVSVARVRPAHDLKRATVFIACPPGQEAGSLEHLVGAAGFIKKQLGRKMRLRTMPELDFELDTALDLERRLTPQGGVPGGDSPYGVSGDLPCRPAVKSDEEADR